MINIMLVAGEKTTKLAAFLRQRGTFQIDFTFRSLSEDLNKVRDSIINVDKLVYVLDKPEVNIRMEMQVLKELLNNDGFFVVQEILFIITESEEAKSALRYFNAVMDSCNFEQFKIINSSNKLAFADIFDYIVGVTNSDNYDNTFRDVYRVERYSDSSVAYIGTEDSDLIVEPFDYERVSLYEAAKNVSKKAESGVIHHDVMPEHNIVQFDAPNLGSLDMIVHKSSTQTIIVTGERKTGISTWSIALATSAFSSGKSVLLFDFTDNNDIENIMMLEQLSYKKLTMLQLLHNYNFDSNCLYIVNSSKSNEKAIIQEFICNLYSTELQLPAVIVIALPEHRLTDMTSVINKDITKIIYCINPLLSDITSKQLVLEKLSSKFNINVVLNNRIKLIADRYLVDSKVVTELLPFDLKVIQPIDFTSLNIDAGLYKTLMEV